MSEVNVTLRTGTHGITFLFQTHNLRLETNFTQVCKQTQMADSGLKNWYMNDSFKLTKYNKNMSKTAINSNFAMKIDT